GVPRIHAAQRSLLAAGNPAPSHFCHRRDDDVARPDRVYLTWRACRPAGGRGRSAQGYLAIGRQWPKPVHDRARRLSHQKRLALTPEKDIGRERAVHERRQIVHEPIDAQFVLIWLAPSGSRCRAVSSQISCVSAWLLFGWA